MQPLVSIIIVNWNGKQWLPACFHSIYQQTWRRFEVIFVDNASTDDSVAWVRKKYPKTKIIQSDINVGFAQGNNLGIHRAKGKYILFLNNDTRVTKSAITELVYALHKYDDVAGAQSKLLLMSDRRRLDTVGAFFTWTGFLYHYGLAERDSKKYSRVIDLYTAKGACMMFKTKILKSMVINEELFEPGYFAYFEETDICHRVWMEGYRIIFVPTSIVYHKLGGTSTKMNNAYIQYHSFKNRIHTYLKNLEYSSLFRLLPIHLMYCEAFAILSLLKGKPGIFVSIQKAIWWNIRQFRVTMSKRRYIQLRRKKRDGELFPYILKNQNIWYYISIAQKLS